ncbi:MAG: hypothetical protein ACREKF_07010 [Candidatus Methylomirabilales bacterium]
MEITVAEQGLFLLSAKVAHDQAKERAWEQKLNVFGTLSKFLMRPKGEEIQVNLLELRYQPFWHAASHKRFRYDRRTQYHVPIPVDVQTVDVAGQTYAPSGGRVALQAVDHCLLEEKRELFLDALSGEVQELRRYLTFDRVAAADGQAFAPDVALVPPEVRASAVIRQVLGDVMQPPSADQVLEEEVVVDCLDLYYRPVYAFEYVWEAKSKRATVEVDGLTAEFKPMGKAFGAQLKKMLNREMLFDIGAETLNLVVPGGAIAVKLTKAVMDRRQTKTP